MTLAEVQGALARYCLSPTPDPADAEILGDDRARWDLYRAMVRHRFEETVGEALPRVRSALGSAALGAAIERFLAVCPPTPRYVRELGERFADHLVAQGLSHGAPPWLADLARLEKSRMEVLCEQDVSGDAIGDFEMDRPAGFAPWHRLLRVAWDVHRHDPPEGHVPGTFALLVYREPVGHRAMVLELSPIAGDLVEAMAPGDRTVTACVIDVLQRHNASAGAVFTTSFAGLLGDLMDKGVLLGARIPPERAPGDPSSTPPLR